MDARALPEYAFADLPLDRIANLLGFESAHTTVLTGGKQRTFHGMLKESVSQAFPFYNRENQARYTRYYNTVFRDERLTLTVAPMTEGGQRFALLFLSTSPPCVWKVCYPG